MRHRFIVAVGAFALLGSPFAFALASGSAIQKAETLVRAMAKGDFVSPEKEFTTTMQQAAAPKQLEFIWSEKTHKLGPFKGLGETKTVGYENYTIVFVRTRFKAASLWVKVVLTSNGKIAGLFFIPSSPPD